MLGKSLQKLKKILISKNSVLFAFFQWRKSGLLLKAVNYLTNSGGL